MLNQTNHQNLSISNPILFLQPPFDSKSREIRDELITYCQQKRYGKLKTVKSKGPYDYYNLHNLINRVGESQNIFTTIFIDHYSLHTPLNKILWAVLGTLKRSKQIKIYAYVKRRGVLSIRPLKTHESKNLLAQAIIYDKSPDMGSWNKWRTFAGGEMWQRVEDIPSETARYYDWEEVKDDEADSGIIE